MKNYEPKARVGTTGQLQLYTMRFYAVGKNRQGYKHIKTFNVPCRVPKWYIALKLQTIV